MQVKHFLRLGQRNDQWMVSPLAFVVDADALFLFTAGLDHRSVGFDRGLIKERIRLLFPDGLPSSVDGLHYVECL